MMSLNFRILKTFLLCASIGSAVGFDIKLMLNNETVDPLDFLIPTVYSENEKCRSHSLMYRMELPKFTVWATDMFDASSKFPTGMFIGSIYDTGNFDECVQVHLPEKFGFSGQHCMAHFKLKPLSPVVVKNGHFFEYDQYENIYNITTWQKITKYSQDPSKQTRDEMYFSFCLPSTCSSEDLERSLKQTVEIMEHVLPFGLEVDVNERNCQIERSFNYSRGNVIYMVIVGIFILIGIACTLYHVLTELDGLEKYHLTGKAHEVLLAFSFSRTLRKMVSESKNEDGSNCINGLKVTSLYFLFMGHRIMYCISSPMSNPVYVEERYRKMRWVFMMYGPISVDTFFAISGYLACYLILLELSKRKHMVNIGLIYLHRFLRLLPAYAVVIGFYCTIFFELGEGPFWSERVGVEQERCIKSWWANLLYINNYVNIDNICMLQSWYLTCDTHFFLMAPILAHLLWKKPKIGLWLLGVLIGISLLIPFIVIIVNKEEPTILPFIKFMRDPTTNHTFKTVYIPSHMRACAYLIGILGGYLKFMIRTSKYKISNQVAYWGWIIGLFSVNALYISSFTFFMPSEEKDYFYAAIHGSMGHLIWGLCIIWVVIATSEGCGTLIAPIYNFRPFTFLSRISYPTFLCHAAIQLYSAATTRAPEYTGVFSVICYTASDCVLAYTAGLVLSLVFEAPVIALEKIFLRKSSNGRKKQIQNGCDKKPGSQGFVDVYIAKIPKIPSWDKTQFPDEIKYPIQQ